MALRYSVGQILSQKCDQCDDDLAHFQVQKPLGDLWFANCQKCGKKIELEQKLED